MLELDDNWSIKVSWQEHEGRRRLDVRLCRQSRPGYWEWTKIGLMIPEELAQEFATLASEVVQRGGVS